MSEAAIASLRERQLAAGLAAQQQAAAFMAQQHISAAMAMGAFPFGLPPASMQGMSDSTLAC